MKPYIGFWKWSINKFRDMEWMLIFIPVLVIGLLFGIVVLTAILWIFIGGFALIIGIPLFVLSTMYIFYLVEVKL